MGIICAIVLVAVSAACCIAPFAMEADCSIGGGD
jgi:hypothetical protein